jgi:CHASE2 domain-containing sensor protein
MDGALRRHLIAMQPNAGSPCTTRYAFSAQLAFHYLAAAGISARFNQDQNLQIGDVVFQRLRSRTGGYQSVDAWGYQILLNYRAYHPDLGIAPTVTLGEVFAGKLKPEQVRNRIVLIGVTAQSAHDYIATPYSGGSGDYEEMPGVLVQAQMLSQILSAVQDRRSLLEALPFWGEVLWLWLWAIAGAMLSVWWCTPSMSRSRVYWFFVASAGLAGLYLLSFLCLIHGRWVPLVPAVITFLGASGTVTVYSLSGIADRNDEKDVHP